MQIRVKGLVTLLLAAAVLAAAEDRLAVLEFFGRTGCTNCRAAGVVIDELQAEMRGRALLLEYDVDLFRYGRQERYLVADPEAAFLPLLMVGSGYRTSSGWKDFEPLIRDMLDDELARPPRAEVTAYWRRMGSSLRAYVRAGNLGPADLEVDRDAGIWVIAYENAELGLTQTWVQSTALWYLPYDLAPGEHITATIDTPPVNGINWGRMSAAVMVEDRPRRNGPYDMLQAAAAAPAALAASPGTVMLNAVRSEAEVALGGPHVLSWSASSDVPWLELSPDSGTVPGTLTLRLLTGQLPAPAGEATVTVSATGDDMSFAETVTVRVGNQLRRAGRRVSPGR